MYKILKAETSGRLRFILWLYMHRVLQAIVSQDSSSSSRWTRRVREFPLTICDYDREEGTGNHRIPG